MEVNIDQKYMKQRYNKKISKNDAKMKRPKAADPKEPRAPQVPEEVRSCSRDSRSRSPLASNIVKKNKHPANN